MSASAGRRGEAGPTVAGAPPAWDLADPAQRRRAALSYQLTDHALLRHGWTNAAEVAPGVWRSNHPTHGRLAGLAARGVRAILNLRGANGGAPYLFEEESCRALGLTLVSIPLRARVAPPREDAAALFAAFRTIERPFLMHCKSGADRTGLAAALYLLAHGGQNGDATVAEAKRQLSWRFWHLRGSRAGILGHVLDLYAARLGAGPIDVETWFATEYDAQAAQAGFRA